MQNNKIPPKKKSFHFGLEDSRSSESSIKIN